MKCLGKMIRSLNHDLEKCEGRCTGAKGEQARARIGMGWPSPVYFSLVDFGEENEEVIGAGVLSPKGFLWGKCPDNVSTYTGLTRTLGPLSAVMRYRPIIDYLYTV